MWTAASIVSHIEHRHYCTAYNTLLVHDPQVLKAVRDLAALLHVPHHEDPAVQLNVRDSTMDT